MRSRSWLPKIVVLFLLAAAIFSVVWVLTISSVECVKLDGCNKREWEIVNEALGQNILRFNYLNLEDQLKKDPSVNGVFFVKTFKKLSVEIRTDQTSFTVGVVDILDQSESSQSATLVYKLGKIKSLQTQGPSKIYSLYKDGQIVSSTKSDFNFLVYASKPISQDSWMNYGRSFDFISKVQSHKLVFLDNEGFVWLDSQVIMVFDITKDLQSIWDTLQQIRQASRIEDALLIDMRFKKPTITYLQGQ